MVAHQNQKQRLQEVYDALDNLATGKRLYKRDIFPEGDRKTWHAGLLARLIKEELLIRHTNNGGGSTQYEAVDGPWFAKLISDEIKLAEWYFRQGAFPDAGPAIVEDPAPPPPEPDPPQEDVKEDPPTPQEAGDIQTQILNTLLLCAENLVFLRDRVLELHEKVDALSTEVEAIKAKR